MAAINKRKLLESAQKNLQKGALDKALKDYQELLAADPRDSNVRLKVGDLQLKRGNADDAIAAYLKVADQFMRDGFDAKAVAIYKQVTKIDGKRFDVYIPLADLYQRIGLTTDAMAALQTAAEAYQREGRRREALDLLRRMASLDPTNTASRLKVAELLHQEQLASEAIAEFDEAARELSRQGDWEACAGVLQRMLEVTPDRVETHDALIALWLERRHPERAEPFARKLVAVDPARAESHETLAAILTERGNTAGAIEAYRSAAEAWIARGDEERARGILQRHVPSEPFDGGAESSPPPGAITSPIAESPFGDEGIGDEPPAPAPSEDVEFELELDDVTPDAAPEPVPAARAVAPSPPAITTPVVESADEEVVEADVEQLLAEAAVYLRYGKHERAIASFEAALEYEPQHLGALEQLGEALLRLGRRDAASAAWTRGVAVASGAGDAECVTRLRARIEALDGGVALEPASTAPPQVAAKPALTAPPQVAVAAATVLFDATLPEPVSEDPDPAGDFVEIEIDLDGAAFDSEPSAAGEDASVPSAEMSTADPDVTEGEGGIEVEIDLASFGEVSLPDESSDTEQSTAPALDASASGSEPIALESEAAALLDDESIRVSTSTALDESPIELSIEETPAEISIQEPSLAAPPSSIEDEIPASFGDAPEPELERTPPASDPALIAVAPEASVTPVPPAELSTTTAQQILEDLEEASFYFEQGLLDEADAIYRRVVQRAPQHPGALLRLGEIAVARGADPSRLESAAADAPELAIEAAALEADADAAPTIEPPDDLDLTAREFGPENAWQDDADEDVEAVEPVEPESLTVPEDAADASLESTDRAEELAVESPPALTVESPAALAEVAPEPASDEPGESEEPAAALVTEPEERPLELTEPQIPAERDGTPAFDLAAELSEAFREDPATPQHGARTDEDGFASLFRDFKRGVSRTLGEGDVETHFDLGIAYREMGLLDDAIGEFHYALASSSRRLDALHMMGLCALDVGRAADAVGHLEQALASPDVPNEREVALRFDLGRAYEAHGDRERATDAYARVVELDAEFQDATQRLTALQGAPQVAPEEVPIVEEAYESFDDLVAQHAEASGEPPVEASETYENFDEFQDESAGDEPTESPASIAADDATPLADDWALATPDAEPQTDPAEETAREPEAEPELEPVEAPAEPPKTRRKISFF